MNADPLEIQKFSELAHRWWDPTSEFRPLHEINPLRLEWINAKVPLSGKKVIDIGCGGGWIKKGLKRYVKWSVGLDLSIEMRFGITMQMQMFLSLFQKQKHLGLCSGRRCI